MLNIDQDIFQDNLLTVSAVQIVLSGQIVFSSGRKWREILSLSSSVREVLMLSSPVREVLNLSSPMREVLILSSPEKEG